MTTQTTPNVPLLCKTLAHIEANPSEWAQESWRCGSGMCFAGWAAELGGGAWHAGPDDYGELFDSTPRAVAMVADDEDDPEDLLTLDDGTRVIHVRARASRILGLIAEEADWLFQAGNDLADLQDAVKQICGEATP